MRKGCLTRPDLLSARPCWLPAPDTPCSGFAKNLASIQCNRKKQLQNWMLLTRINTDMQRLPGMETQQWQAQHLCQPLKACSWRRLTKWGKWEDTLLAAVLGGRPHRKCHSRPWWRKHSKTFGRPWLYTCNIFELIHIHIQLPSIYNSVNIDSRHINLKCANRSL